MRLHSESRHKYQHYKIKNIAMDGYAAFLFDLIKTLN